jgi:predicted Zn-dependent protease
VLLRIAGQRPLRLAAIPAVLLSISVFMCHVGCATASGLEGLGNEYFTLAKESEAKKDEEKAVAYYRKSISLQPDNRLARLNLSRLLLAKEEFDQAGALLRGLLLEDPGNQTVKEAQAYLLARQQRWQDAWELYAEVNAKTDGRVSVLYNLALIGRELGKVAEAADYAGDLADLRPGEPRYQRLAMECALSAGRADRLEHYMVSYLDAAKAKPDDMVDCARVLRELGQDALARRVLDSVFSVDSKNPKAWLSLAELQVGADIGVATAALTKALEGGLTGNDDLRRLVGRADQAGQAVLLDAIRKKFPDFSVFERMPGKIPGSFGHLPGEY